MRRQHEEKIRMEEERRKRFAYHFLAKTLKDNKCSPLHNWLSHMAK